MLGWEFPPFITGGLGTACHGLTKAMSSRGVDVTFVLPKGVRGEHASHVDLVAPGANDDAPSIATRGDAGLPTGVAVDRRGADRGIAARRAPRWRRGRTARPPRRARRRWPCPAGCA